VEEGRVDVARHMFLLSRESEVSRLINVSDASACTSLGLQEALQFPAVSSVHL
jgi:hypothetical protein